MHLRWQVFSFMKKTSILSTTVVICRCFNFNPGLKHGTIFQEGTSAFVCEEFLFSPEIARALQVDSRQHKRNLPDITGMLDVSQRHVSHFSRAFSSHFVP